MLIWSTHWAELTLLAEAFMVFGLVLGKLYEILDA
jgi:hypothetical protein